MEPLHRAKGVTQRDVVLGTALGTSVCAETVSANLMYQHRKPPTSFHRAYVDLWRVSISF